MKTNKGIAPLIVLAIILGVLVVGGGAYWAGKNEANKKFINFDNNQIQEQNKEIIQKENKIEQNKEMSLIFNDKKYSFVNSECKIGGTIDRGVETWGMSVGLTEKDNDYGIKNIYFSFYSNENNIESYLKNNTNIATKGVKISNNLTSSTYSDKVSDDISVVWNEINTKNDTFSGNGYIEIKKDRKPNVGICNGTEIVNQKYITPNDPEYKYMCPSPVIPIQKIYFKCTNGVIYRTPSGMTY